jgi:hypothetical protein
MIHKCQCGEVMVAQESRWEADNEGRPVWVRLMICPLWKLAQASKHDRVWVHTTLSGLVNG